MIWVTRLVRCTQRSKGGKQHDGIHVQSARQAHGSVQRAFPPRRVALACAGVVWATSILKAAPAHRWIIPSMSSPKSRFVFMPWACATKTAPQSIIEVLRAARRDARMRQFLARARRPACA